MAVEVLPGYVLDVVHAELMRGESGRRGKYPVALWALKAGIGVER